MSAMKIGITCTIYSLLIANMVLLCFCSLGMKFFSFIMSAPHCILVLCTASMVWQVDGVTGREVSYAELETMVAKVSSSLVRLGLVKKGSLVTMYCLNSIEYVVFYLAATSAGAVVSPVNPAYTIRMYPCVPVDGWILLCCSIVFTLFNFTVFVLSVLTACVSFSTGISDMIRHFCLIRHSRECNWNKSINDHSRRII